MDSVRVTVVGAGYVGLVTAAGMAHLGHHVTVVESEPTRISEVLDGRLPIREPGLNELIAEGYANGRFGITDRYHDPGEYVLVCVDTPAQGDGSADISRVMGAVRELVRESEPGARPTVVLRSTVPPGTGDRVAAALAKSGMPVHVVSNPEFLRESTAVYDFLHPARIVIGGESPGTDAVARLYDSVDAPRIIVSRRSAELAKYAANAHLAARISLMNEIATIAEEVGADILEVERVVGSDPRIGPAFLRAGIGWGGSCFPKDVSALTRMDGRPRILDAVERVNEDARRRALRLVLSATSGVAHPVVGILGLAFKPDTSDARGSIGMWLATALLEAGVAVRAHDPVVASPFVVDPDPYAAVAGVDALVLVTEWAIYRELDWERVAREMRGTLVVDGRNVLDRDRLRALGLEYVGYGRGE